MPGFTSESNVTVAAPAEPAIASRAAAAPHVSALNVIFPPSLQYVECLLDCSGQCTDNAGNWRCPKMGVFRDGAALETPPARDASVRGGESSGAVACRLAGERRVTPAANPPYLRAL